MTFEQIMEHEGFLPNPEQRKVIESTVNTVVSAGDAIQICERS